MAYYKGFKKDLTCRGFQYKEGVWQHVSDEASLCNEGVHACEAPLDVLKYYSPANSQYRKVELSGVSSERKDDSKVVATDIRVGAELGIHGLVKAQIEYVKSKTTFEHTDPKQATAGNSGAATAGNFGAATAGNFGAATAGDSGAATAGNSGAATAGNFGAATAGNSGAATAGNFGAATAGNFGAATAGDSGAATAGDSGAATAGDSGAATAGDSGAATAGDSGAATAGNFGAATAGNSGAATSRGKSKTGKDGLCVARGNGVKVCGGLGSLLVIAEESEDSYQIVSWKAIIVDGEIIKPDTWYELKDGELVEVVDE